MKVKTSVTLSEELLHAIDAQAGQRSAPWTRSTTRRLYDERRALPRPASHLPRLETRARIRRGQPPGPRGITLLHGDLRAPVYSRYDGLATQVPIGMEEGLKHESSVHCDELMSLLKASLTHFVGTLGPDKGLALDAALRVALALD